MNKWIKKKKVTIAAITAVMALGVSAMSPLPKKAGEAEGSKVRLGDKSENSFLSAEFMGRNMILPSNLMFNKNFAKIDMQDFSKNTMAANFGLPISSIAGRNIDPLVAGYHAGGETSVLSLDGTQGDTSTPPEGEGTVTPPEGESTVTPPAGGSDQEKTNPGGTDDSQTSQNGDGQTGQDETENTQDKVEEIKDQEPAPEFLKMGVDHPIVAELQQRLMELGFMDYAEPTEHFGSITMGAVMIFQRQNELKQDGIVGPETLAAIMSPDCKQYAVFMGAKGDDVTRIQNRLYEMGYLPTADMVTGYFGDVTEAAVKKMQEINGLLVDGKVGLQTIDLLYSDDVKPNLLSFGDRSEVVKASQDRLKELGYLTGTPDGVYGSDTAAAVKQFQSRNDLVVDGYLGPTTRQVLNSSNAIPNGLSLGDRNDNVAKVQGLLSKYGYISSANATGYFGEITEQAVKSFQSNNGLTVDGTVGIKTMEVLTSGNAKKASSGNGSSSGNSSSGNSNSSNGSSSGGNSSGSTNNGSTGNNSGSSNSNKGESNNGSSSGNNAAVSSSVSELIRVAKSKVGSPYVLGAKGPNSFDCSGFVYWSLNQVGVKQSYMTSYGWRSVGKYMKVSNFSDIKAGDIVVVYGHVGIAAGNGMVVDASSSSGKIVYRELGSWWKNRFIVAWRIF